MCVQNILCAAYTRRFLRSESRLSPCLAHFVNYKSPFALHSGGSSLRYKPPPNPAETCLRRPLFHNLENDSYAAKLTRVAGDESCDRGTPLRKALLGEQRGSDAGHFSRDVSQRSYPVADTIDG